MFNRNWLKRQFGRFSEIKHVSRKQGKLAREGRTLRVESLEPRRLLAAWVPPNLAQGEIFHGDFEHPEGFQLESRTQGSVPGNLESPYATQVHRAGSGALPEVKNGSVVPDGAGARAGNSVFESHIEKQTVPSAWYREEVIARPNGLTTPNVDYWYGFSTYYAQDFQPDYSFEIHSQWFVPGTVTGGPLMSLATKSDSGGTINHNTLRLTHDKLGLIATTDLSDLKGKWTDWVVHARWSTSSSGTVEVYRDGQLIGAKNGVTIRSGDIQGGFNGVPKQRLGLYKGSWKTQNQVPNAPAPTEMTVYYDEWRIARSNNGTNLFDVVDPAQGDGGNTPPTAFDDTATTPVNTQVTTVNVLANDTDPNQGDTLSVQSFTQPNNGSVINNGDGTFTYTPNQNFNGVDTFDYTVSDGNGGSDVGTVSLTVGVIAVQSYEFESLVPATASSGDSLETKADAAASGGEWVLYRSEAVGDFVTFTANVSQAGTYDIAMQSRLNAFRGQFQLSIDGTNVGGVNDAYAATPAFGELPLASGVSLSAGSHEFKFTVTGKNLVSGDFQISLDQLELTALEASNGDFDSDGDTDGSDFLQWQRGLGSTHTASDLIDWQDNYDNGSTVAAATAPDPIASVNIAPIDESFNEEVTSPVFLLSADMFSPVASRAVDDALLDEAFADSGELTNAAQQSQLFELESDASTPLAQEEAEEEEESESSFADSLDLAFQLL